MRENVTSAPSVDGPTVYVMPGAGIGATIDTALAAEPAARHIVVCGERPGSGVTGARAWLSDAGDWWQADRPHVTRSSLRARMARTGRPPVYVSRVEPWLGVGVDPTTAADAMRIVRGVCADVGVRPSGTPGQTGRRMLAAHLARLGHTADLLPEMPDHLADLLRATTGQGRFELFPAAGAGGELLAYVDARYQSAACAATELPAGVPELIAGAPADDYAPAWCEVTWTPGAGPVGILPYFTGKRWTWPSGGAGWQPATGGFRGWVSGAELHLARVNGYRVDVHRSIVWPERTRLMGPFANHLVRHRERIDRLAVPVPVRDAARFAVRAILIQTVGGLHRPAAGGNVAGVSFASANGMGERPAITPGVVASRPEWSTAIWALARCRIARVMLEQTAPLVAATLDGFYVAGEPELTPDNGRPGVFREEWRLVAGAGWPPLSNLSELYAIGGGA